VDACANSREAVPPGQGPAASRAVRAMKPVIAREALGLITWTRVMPVLAPVAPVAGGSRGCGAEAGTRLPGAGAARSPGFRFSWSSGSSLAVRTPRSCSGQRRRRSEAGSA
jgi:hypothetical protein